MKTIKSLSFVSVEGFWDKPVHDERMAEAAEKLLANPQAFAIATATHAPASCASFTDIPLGQYTANKLIQDYNIAPLRILPAYLFDQKTTYTIIDAYSNSIMIGWLCCGLSQREETINAELTPVTAGFHAQAERILALNTRAVKILESLSVKVTIQPPSTIMPFEQLLIENPEEANKLVKIQEPAGILEAGTWNGNSGIKRSFDNIEAMRTEISKAFGIVFGTHVNDSILFRLTDVERLLLTFMWNIKANTSAITNDDWNTIYGQFGDYFDGEMKNAEIDLAKNKLITLGFIR